jgi:hypothetical protein
MSNGKIRSCRFVCSTEGHPKQDKRDHLTKCPRAETRTDCEVRMGHILDQQAETYIVSALVLGHNHNLYLPETSHLMASQRKILELQDLKIEMTNASGIRPKAAHELAN